MTESAQKQEFAALYSKCHLDLLRYILTLLPYRDQAEDVLQETAQVIWKKFDQYDQERPFLPWARKFAYFEVLRHRKKQSIRFKYFSDELVENMAVEREEQDEMLDAGREALAGCMAKLDDTSSELLLDRFSRGIALKELAARQGRSANSLYLVMHRIRQRLVECVNATLDEQGWAH
jgi:RNA polymerase sigma-70 factor (ECF subfamily)